MPVLLVLQLGWRHLYLQGQPAADREACTQNRRQNCAHADVDGDDTVDATAQYPRWRRETALRACKLLHTISRFVDQYHAARLRRQLFEQLQQRQAASGLPEPPTVDVMSSDLLSLLP